MGRGSARGPGRRRADDTPLTRVRIVEAALRLVDEHGISALSMRRLASELDAHPMSLYHHLSNKEALLAAMVEAVVGRFQAPPEEGTWQERVLAFAFAYRDVVRAHPNLVRHLIANAAVAAPGAATVGEFLYAALEAAGLSPDVVVHAADLIVDYIHGFALSEVAAPSGPTEHRQDLLTFLQEQPADRTPSMRRVLASIGNDDLRADFAFGLDVILMGLERLTTSPCRQPDR